MSEDLKEELRHDLKGEGAGPPWKAAMRKMGRDGWIGLGWPKRFGGRGSLRVQRRV